MRNWLAFRITRHDFRITKRFFSFNSLKLKILKKKKENNCYLKKFFQGSIFNLEYNNQNLYYKQKSLKLTCQRNLISEIILISLFEPSVAFHIETTQQTFVGLQDVFKTCLEDVFNTSSA